MTEAAWDEVFRRLLAWRAEQAAASVEEPSVTAIAGLWKRDPWAVLVSTIISLRTKDAVTLSSSRRLLAKAPTPQALLDLEGPELEELVYPAGFYRNKAASLRRIAAILIERYEGKVPADADALMDLPGVGLKTANLVLGEAFGQDAICVDIHVHRISNRRGWIATAAPDESEAALRAVLPRRWWRPINALLVLFGQKVCAPASPRCSQCPVSGDCPKRGVGKTR